MTKATKSRSAIIENQFFGEGYYNFSLKIGQLKRLQELTGMGPMALYTKIREGNWMYEDIQETIRLGLIGGGTDPKTAFDLTETYTGPAYLGECAPLALLILHVVIFGYEEEDEADPDQDDEEDDGEDLKKN